MLFKNNKLILITAMINILLLYVSFSSISFAGTSASDVYNIFGEVRPILAVRNSDGTWDTASTDLRLGITQSNDKKRKGLDRFDILIDASRSANSDIPENCSGVFKSTWRTFKKTFKGKGEWAPPPTSKLWPTRFSPAGEEAQRVELSNRTCKVLLEVGGPSEKYLTDYPGLTKDDVVQRTKTTVYPNDLGVAFVGKHGRITFIEGNKKTSKEFLIEHSEPPNP